MSRNPMNEGAMRRADALERMAQRLRDLSALAERIGEPDLVGLIDSVYHAVGRRAVTRLSNVQSSEPARVAPARRARKTPTIPVARRSVPLGKSHEAG